MTANAAALWWILGGGEVACDETLYDTGGLRDYLVRYTHRSRNLGHLRLISRELIRLDDAFGYNDDAMLLAGT